MFWAENWKLSKFLYENFQFLAEKKIYIFEEACFRNETMKTESDCMGAQADLSTVVRFLTLQLRFVFVQVL